MSCYYRPQGKVTFSEACISFFSQRKKGLSSGQKPLQIETPNRDPRQIPPPQKPRQRPPRQRPHRQRPSDSKSSSAFKLSSGVNKEYTTKFHQGYQYISMQFNDISLANGKSTSLANIYTLANSLLPLKTQLTCCIYWYRFAFQHLPHI